MTRLFSDMMLMSDPPDHARLRKLANKAFTPRVVERMRSSIQTTTDGLLALLQNRDQLEKLRAGPEMIDSAVGEFLRYDSPIQSAARIAMEDIELSGQRIDKGQRVTMMVGAANRDPERFPNPDRLDIARVRSVLRRRLPRFETPSDLFERDGLVVDLSSRKTTLNGCMVHLTPTEFKLMGILVRYMDKVVTAAQILTEVWGEEYSGDLPVLRTNIGRLRKKIEPDPANPTIILTESGIGYSLSC